MRWAAAKFGSTQGSTDGPLIGGIISTRSPAAARREQHEKERCSEEKAQPDLPPMQSGLVPGVGHRGKCKVVGTEREHDGAKPAVGNIFASGPCLRIRVPSGRWALSLFWLKGRLIPGRRLGYPIPGCSR
ncbi:hypothetical protein RB597_003535 [Gaeumannomyces tritici]